MVVVFKNVRDENIRECFREVLERYDELHDHRIALVQKHIKTSTMQAQPVFTFKSLFGNIKRYKINLGYHIRNRRELLIEELPEDVLVGWFAHELGHVLDYRRHSMFQMLIYGLRYYFSRSFRRKAEHQADYFAIKYGFHEEIIATKNFILDHELVEEKYKKKIRKYYMAEERVRMCAEDKSLLKPYIDI